MQNNDIISLLENQASSRFIKEHINDDVVQLALKKNEAVRDTLLDCLNLIKLYQKAKKKLPHLLEILPALDSRSYQQASSETLAKYKASLINGHKILDLTAGLGIDAIAFSSTFTKVIAIERNQTLFEYARYNADKLGIKNIEWINQDGLGSITSNVDWVYIDPDRRSGEKRVVALHLLEPNILELLTHLRQISNKLMVKLSPLFEIKELFKLLPGCFNISVISEHQDVKEVLIQVDLHNPNPNQIELHAIELGNRAFSFSRVYSNKPITITPISANPIYIAVPISILIKMHLAEVFMESIGGAKHEDFQIYSLPEFVESNGIHLYSCIETLKATKKSISTVLKKYSIKNCTFIVKGSSKHVSTFYKEFKVTEGGEHVLFLLYGVNPVAYLCKKLL